MGTLISASAAPHYGEHKTSDRLLRIHVTFHVWRELGENEDEWTGNAEIVESRQSTQSNILIYTHSMGEILLALFSANTSQVLCEVAWRSNRSWPHFACDWLKSSWRYGTIVSHCFGSDSTDVRKEKKKEEKKRASLTEDEIEVATESVRTSMGTVGPIWSQWQE